MAACLERAFLAALLITACDAAAEPAAVPEPKGASAGVVFASSGVEEAVAPLALGGAACVKVRGRVLMLALEWTVPMLGFDLYDAKYRTWADVDLFAESSLNVRVRLGMFAITTQNDAFRAQSVGSQLALFPGIYRPTWSVAAELVASWVWATRFVTTEYARSQGASAVPAWLAFPAVGLEAGIRAGYVIGPVELSVRAGFDRRGAYNLAVPPIYLCAGVSVRIERSPPAQVP